MQYFADTIVTALFMQDVCLLVMAKLSAGSFRMAHCGNQKKKIKIDVCIGTHPPINFLSCKNIIKIYQLDMWTTMVWLQEA